MSTYVMSDIHGQYDAYIKMLEKINFSDEDMLYVIGDVIDRGPFPLKIVLDMMSRPNIVLLAGNHEYMAMQCFNFLLQEITEENINKLLENEDEVEKFLNWSLNGADTTISAFYKMSLSERKEITDYFEEADLYEEVQVGDREYILVHAGLGNFEPEKEIWDYDIYDLVWERPDYDKKYFEDKYIVSGHTPTRAIPGNIRPDLIYRKNNNIVIDCGAGCGGKLGCLCLETDEEFYVDIEE